MKRVLSASISMFLAFLCGCASTPSSKEASSAGVLENTRLGLKGYTLDLPEGFTKIDRQAPPSGDEHPLAFVLVKKIQNSPPERWPNGQLKISESHILASSKIVVLFEIQTSTAAFPFREMSKKEREKVFQVLANHNRFWREAVMVTHAPAEYLARAGQEMVEGYEGRVAREDRAVIGSRNEIYYFTGWAPLQHTGTLHTTMEDLVSRLKF